MLVVLDRRGEVGARPSLRRLVLLAFAAAWVPGCRAPHAPGALPARPRLQDPGPPAAPPPSSDPELATGTMLRPMRDGWAVRLRLPLSLALAKFDLDKGVSLDDLKTVAFVPTAEFMIPLDERWTLLPYAGVGGALQSGDTDVTGDNSGLGLFSTGLRAQRWQPLGGRSTFFSKAELRYDSVHTGRDGLLGDWGSIDVALELRRALGDPDSAGFEPGVYVQGVWYWDRVELDIDGVTPRFVDDQVEWGFSFGTAKPHRILGLSLPRAYLGLRTGDEVQILSLRFGRL